MRIHSVLYDSREQMMIGVEDMSDEGWRLRKLTRLMGGAIQAEFEQVEVRGERDALSTRRYGGEA